MKVSSKGRTALVVEDDWFIREDIAAQFREEGWEVLEAETGAQALELLREGQSIDILVTDITLADSITGWEVAEALRHLHPQVPVIYASGGRDIESRRVLDSVSVSKPFSAHDLLSAGSRLLHRALTSVEESLRAGTIRPV
jgi:CheY-like chemotaxis protein